MKRNKTEINYIRPIIVQALETVILNKTKEEKLKEERCLKKLNQNRTWGNKTKNKPEDRS